MQSAPVVSPLAFLFHKAFLPCQTGHGESGTKFGLQRRAGETILLFRTDGDGKVKGGNIYTFAAHFGIGDDEPRADVLLFYAREQQGQGFICRLAFIEMKGRDISHAFKQLERMVIAVKDTLMPILGKPLFQAGNLRAIIVSRRSPPEDLKRMQKEFAMRRGFAPQVCKHNDERELRQQLLG